MKKFVMAAVAGTLAGGIATTQIAGPLLAQEGERDSSVYEQLDLFGDIFERIRAQYVEEVDEGELIDRIQQAIGSVAGVDANGVVDRGDGDAEVAGSFLPREYVAGEEVEPLGRRGHVAAEAEAEVGRLGVCFQLRQQIA